MLYRDNTEGYKEIRINLRKEEKGSQLVTYLEKAANKLDFYIERENVTGMMCGNSGLNNGDCIKISFFSPLSKLLHLYIGEFSVYINKHANYNSLAVMDEPLASLKKVKQLSQKLESKMEEILK